MEFFREIYPFWRTEKQMESGGKLLIFRFISKMSPFYGIKTSQLQSIQLKRLNYNSYQKIRKDFFPELNFRSFLKSLVVNIDLHLGKNVANTRLWPQEVICYIRIGGYSITDRPDTLGTKSGHEWIIRSVITCWLCR